jgi:hypothetical protein
VVSTLFIDGFDLYDDQGPGDPKRFAPADSPFQFNQEPVTEVVLRRADGSIAFTYKIEEGTSLAFQFGGGGSWLAQLG